MALIWLKFTFGQSCWLPKGTQSYQHLSQNLSWHYLLSLNQKNYLIYILACFSRNYTTTTILYFNNLFFPNFSKRPIRKLINTDKCTCCYRVKTRMPCNWWLGAKWLKLQFSCHSKILILFKETLLIFI